MSGSCATGSRDEIKTEQVQQQTQAETGQSPAGTEQ